MCLSEKKETSRRGGRAQSLQRASARISDRLTTAHLVWLAGNPAVSCLRDRRLCVPALRRVCLCLQGRGHDAFPGVAATIQNCVQATCSTSCRGACCKCLDVETCEFGYSEGASDNSLADTANNRTSGAHRGYTAQVRSSGFISRLWGRASCAAPPSETHRSPASGRPVDERPLSVSRFSRNALSNAAYMR